MRRRRTSGQDAADLFMAAEDVPDERHSAPAEQVPTVLTSGTFVTGATVSQSSVAGGDIDEYYALSDGGGGGAVPQRF